MHHPAASIDPAGGNAFSSPFVRMTSADTSAASFAPSFAESKGRSLWRFVAPFAVGVALLSACLTFVVLTGLTRIEPTREVVLSFILINAATILVLVGIIAREVWQVMQARRRGRAAARLHIQVVSLFSVIAVLPAVLVAIIANVTIDRGFDRLFSGPTREVIQNSLIVAHAYMQEHAQLIRGDILGMGNDIAHARPLFDQDRKSFRELLTSSAASRNLPGAMLIDKDRNILETAQTGIQLAFTTPPPEFLSNIDETEPQIAVFPEANYVAAVIRLRAFNDTFLYVARLLDPHVVAQLRQTEASVAEYAELEQRRLGLKVIYALIFALIALTILMASILIVLNFSNWLVAPIRRLMSAAHIVSTGDLHVQVPVHKSEGDLAQLGETFNKMTQELRSQRDELVNASELIDSRRRFIEAVLSSASAGIIGVDASGSVGILNRSAEKLIGHAESETLGHPLSDVLPELDEMMKAAREGRIAHEIKNPLTPIQLSAERIRRKFGKVITEDKAVFEQCTETIVRQVDDIRRMVDEFSRFARMPKPVIEGEDVADTVRQAVFLMRVGHPDIDIQADVKEEPMRAQFDRRLISQALTNIIKNATEAIDAVPSDQLGKGRVDVIAAREGNDIVIDVIDNGIGLPKVSRARLLEPYVTTREKGTGLGLAIVGRVLEDHGGRIELHDAAEIRPGQRGAWMRLRFAVSGHAAKAEAKAPEGETKVPVSETAGPPDATNPDGTSGATSNETKIEAASGN